MARILEDRDSKRLLLERIAHCLGKSETEIAQRNQETCIQIVNPVETILHPNTRVLILNYLLSLMRHMILCNHSKRKYCVKTSVILNRIISPLRI